MHMYQVKIIIKHNINIYISKIEVFIEMTY